MSLPQTISDREFAGFQSLLQRLAGIHLSPLKKALVCGRLAKRLHHYGLDRYGDYFKLLMSGRAPQELQIALDLLTTNETYFFREPKQLDFLRDRILPARRPGSAFRVWSAACSSGEEVYSIAMLLADAIPEANWDIVGSDLSSRVLEGARSGHYPLQRAEHILPAHRSAYCRKGIGAQEGTFLIDKSLRSRTRFMQINLNEPLPELGSFDVVFLRNVMIYFQHATKRQVVQRILLVLKPGGYLIVGQAESLNGVCDELRSVAPSVYRKE